MGVVDALSGPRLGNFGRQDGQPGRAGGGLLFEFTEEGRVHVGRGENADGRSCQTVLTRRKNGVKAGVITRHFVDAL